MKSAKAILYTKCQSKHKATRPTHTHMSVLLPLPMSNKYTPMGFQDNPGWPFYPQLKLIVKYQTVMDSTEVPPSWPETDNVYKYLFYMSLP
jgi:hypothetical protein